MLLIIVRGLSGSGKSFLSKQITIQHSCEIVEADQFHYEGNEYKWTPARVANAHLWCRLQTDRLLRYNNAVIVSNTFTTLRELIPYWELASELDAEVVIAEPNTSWKYDVEECFKRNQHRVPLESLKTQRNRWVTIPEGRYNPNELLAKYGKVNNENRDAKTTVS